MTAAAPVQDVFARYLSPRELRRVVKSFNDLHGVPGTDRDLNLFRAFLLHLAALEAARPTQNDRN